MADRYWVGGSGNWTAGVGPADTLHWSATSGGAGGASTPTEADNVFFNSASGSANYTVTIATAAARCASLSMLPPSSGNLTLTTSAPTGSLYLCGNVTVSNTRVIWSTANTINNLYFIGTGSNTTIDIPSTVVPYANNVYFGGTYSTANGQLSTFSLASNLNVGNAAATLSYGNLDLSAGRSLRAYRLVSSTNVNVRSIWYGNNGAIILTGFNTTIADFTNSLNFSYTGNSNITLNYTGSVGTRTLSMWISASESQAMNYNITGGTDTIGWSGHASKGLDFTGFSGTLAYPASIPYVYGNIVLSNTMTFGAGSGRTISLRSADSGNVKLIKSAGKAWPYILTFFSGSWKLLDNLTSAAGHSVNLTATIDLNGYTLTTESINMSGGAAKNILFGNTGNSSMNITGSNTVVISAALSGALTYSGIPNISLTYSGNVGTRSVQCGTTLYGSEANSLPIRVSAGSDRVDLAGHFSYVDYRGFSGTANRSAAMTVYGNFIQSSSMTQSESTAVITFAGANSMTRYIDANGVTINCPIAFNNSNANYVLSNSLTTGPNVSAIIATAGNIDFSDKIISCRAFSATGTATRAFNFGNTGGINLYQPPTVNVSTSVFMINTPTNITWVGNSNIQLTGTTGNASLSRSITFGPSGATQNNAPNIIVTTGNEIIAVNGSFTDITFGNWSGGWGGGTKFIYGNIRLPANASIVPAAITCTLSGNRNQIIDVPTQVFDLGLTISKTGGIVTLANSLTMSNARLFTVTQGNFNANNKNVTLAAAHFSATGSTTITMGNGTWRLYGNKSVFGATNMVIANSALCNLYANNSTVILQPEDTAYNVWMGGKSFNNVSIQPLRTNSTVSFRENTNFNDLSGNSSYPYTVAFGSGNTYSVAGFNVSGSNNAAMAKVSAVGATAFNLVYTGNTNVNVNYANISLSSASPATSTWYALKTNNNIDSGSNAGWIFALGDANFFLVF